MCVAAVFLGTIPAMVGSWMCNDVVVVSSHFICPVPWNSTWCVYLYAMRCVFSSHQYFQSFHIGIAFGIILLKVSRDVRQVIFDCAKMWIWGRYWNFALDLGLNEIKRKTNEDERAETRKNREEECRKMAERNFHLRALAVAPNFIGREMRPGGSELL